MILVVSAFFITSVSTEARTWRPNGRTVIKGDFEDVVGTDVRIRTADGMEMVPYAELSLTDKAVVRSNQIKSRQVLKISCKYIQILHPVVITTLPQSYSSTLNVYYPKPLTS